MFFEYLSKTWIFIQKDVMDCCTGSKTRHHKFCPPLPLSKADPVGFGGGDYTNRIPCIYFIFIIYSSFSYNSHLHDPTPNQFTHISSLQREKLFSFVAILRHIGICTLLDLKNLKFFLHVPFFTNNIFVRMI